MTPSVVLFSGGLDSTVLLAQELERADPVWPVYVRTGLAWEAAETQAIDRLLALRPFAGRTKPMTSLSLDMRDVYAPTHWAVAGHAPAYDRPDAEVYLEGRNIVLTAKAGVLCARLGVGRLMLGSLSGNPFPDATAAFFEAMGRALSVGLDRPIELAAPFLHLHKQDVITLGVQLHVPLAETLSCMSPSDDRHCGRCNKCRERRDAFHAAGVQDGAPYATALIR